MRKLLFQFITFSMSGALVAISSNACSDHLAYANTKGSMPVYVGGELGSSFNIRSTANKSQTISSEGYVASIPNFTINVGKKINQYFRPEISFGYRELNQASKYDLRNRNNEIVSHESEHKAKSYLLMLNNYYDIHFNDIITPYIVAGVGISNVKSKPFQTIKLDDEGLSFTDEAATRDTTSLSYQIGVGATIKMSHRLSVNTSIKYLDYGTIRFRDPDTTPINLKGFEFLVGIKATL